MAISVDRIYRFRYCPECDENFSVDRRSCPTCGGRLIGTAVEEHREIRWSGGHLSADAISAALGSEMHHPDPKIEWEPQGTMLNLHSHVFISYVRDDAAVVDRLTAALRKARLHPWIDRKNLAGGQRWKAAIRNAIQEGAGAVVCFSNHYSARQKTYMNEELTLMIDELRQRPTDKSWFIPVRLDDCTIPDRSIGGGETLHDLQRIDLFPDWDAGVRQIVAALCPPPFVKLP